MNNAYGLDNMVSLSQVKLKNLFPYRKKPSKTVHHSTRLLIKLFPLGFKRRRGLKNSLIQKHG